MKVFHVQKTGFVYSLQAYTVYAETDDRYELGEGGYLLKSDADVFIDGKSALLHLDKVNSKLLENYNRFANTEYGDAEKLIRRTSAKEDNN